MEFPEAQDALRRIEALAHTTSPLVVAVDGRSGAGKSTVAGWIAGRYGATLIDQDDFFAGGELDEWQRLSPAEVADRVIDWRRVRRETLEPLRHGLPATWHPFDWETMRGLAREAVIAQPSPVVILDGTYSCRPELAALIDLAILVTLPEAARRVRLAEREGEDLASPWQAIWDAGEDWYFRSVRRPDAFDVVIRRPADAAEGRSGP